MRKQKSRKRPENKEELGLSLSNGCIHHRLKFFRWISYSVSYNTFYFTDLTAENPPSPDCVHFDPLLEFLYCLLQILLIYVPPYCRHMILNILDITRTYCCRDFHHITMQTCDLSLIILFPHSLQNNLVWDGSIVAVLIEAIRNMSRVKKTFIKIQGLE